MGAARVGARGWTGREAAVRLLALEQAVPPKPGLAAALRPGLNAGLWLFSLQGSVAPFLGFGGDAGVGR